MTIYYIFCIFFWNFWSSSLFLVIILVQFCIILVRNGMFSRNKRSSNLVINFYHVIDTMYIYSWKKMMNFWSILVMQLRKSRFFLFAHGSQLDNGVPSPWTYHKVKFSKTWLNAPKTTSSPKNINTTPLPIKYNHVYPLKLYPQQCIYTDGSFIPPSKIS